MMQAGFEIVAGHAEQEQIISGPVKVSTGVLQLEKLSAGDASNRKHKYKR